MLEFSDKPYRYFAPRRVAPIAWLLRWFNRATRLPRMYRIVSVEISGEEGIPDRRDPANRLIFTPNHPSLDPERAADQGAASVWADEAMVVFRILSYRGDYVARNPTLDRFAETVEKLAEDVFSHMFPPSVRGRPSSGSAIPKTSGSTWRRSGGRRGRPPGTSRTGWRPRCRMAWTTSTHPTPTRGGRLFDPRILLLIR